MRFFILLFCLFIFAAFPARAQLDPEYHMPVEEEPEEEAPAVNPDTKPIPGAARPKHEIQKPERLNSTDYVTVPYYEMLVRQAINQRPKHLAFGTLRSYYTETPQYDPIGEATRRKIIGLAFTIQNDTDPAKRKEAFDEYGALISAHLANIDVISQALVLSREDKVFGDPAFFEYVQKGLLRSIVHSGTGRSLVQAYDVMTLGEETILMKALRLRVLKTESAEEGGVYYNMHQVKGADSPEPYWMFVDVTKPMAFLEWQKQNSANVFSMPAQ